MTDQNNEVLPPPPENPPAGMNVVWNGTAWELVPNPVYKSESVDAV